MTPDSSSRRSWPVWPWLVLTLLLGALAFYAPVPKELPEPPRMAEFFNPPVLVAPDGDSYRFVEFGKHADSRQLYAITWMTTAQQSVTRTFGWNAGDVSLGFFHQHAAWQFALSAHRFDAQWKSAADGDVSLPRTELDKLRPLVISELNRRDEARGEQLKLRLDYGLSAESVLCWQNTVVLLAWLALAVTLLTLAHRMLTFLGRDKQPAA